MKKIIILIGAALWAIALTSCNNWLDVKPSGDMEREDLYSLEDGFRTALTGCYIKLKGDKLYGQQMTMTTVEYLAQHWKSTSTDINNFMDLDWKADYAKGQMSGIFSEMYNVINQLNDLLTQMDIQGQEVVKKKEIRYLIQGEALALRAFCHFDILRLFGPSPLDGNKSSVQLPYSEKSGKELVAYYPYDIYVEKLWADLNRADSLLKAVDPVQQLTFEELNDPGALLKADKIIDDFQSYRRVRFNYWALKALEARVALYLGDKQAAYAHAMTVINARVGGLPVGDMSMIIQDINAEWYTLPSETLFAINAYDLMDKIQNIFKETKTVLYKFGTEKDLKDKLFEGTDSDSRNKLWTNMTYEKELHIGTKKYWQQDEEEVKETITYGQQIPILRMAEVYLIATEAAPTLSEGNEKLDIFRKDRGLLTKNCTTFEELKNEVLKEYQKEFYAEGQMFFTYKRMGATEMNWKEDRTIELSEYQIPLPETEYTYK